MLALTADALAGEYLVVGSVGDGRELLAEAERLHPDVIVLDITMPRLDGIEAARQLRCSHRPARLVFLTVHEDADYARAALDAAGKAMSLRRGSLPTSCLPSGQRLQINPLSRPPCASKKRD
jgi:DNA-binding NarL/FixJ family response regulator